MQNPNITGVFQDHTQDLARGSSFLRAGLLDRWMDGLMDGMNGWDHQDEEQCLEILPIALFCSPNNLIQQTVPKVLPALDTVLGARIISRWGN